MESPSLETFKTQQDVVLDNLVYLTLLGQKGEIGDLKMSLPM